MIPARARARWGAITATRPGAAARLFFEGKHFNPFVGRGCPGFRPRRFQQRRLRSFGQLDFVGGANISCGTSNGRPISNRPTPPGHAALGRGLEKGDGGDLSERHRLWAHRVRPIPCAEIISTSIPPIRIATAGRLLRITFDFPDNDLRMSRYISDQLAKIGKAMNPKQMVVSHAAQGLGFGALSDHPQYRRRHDGRRSRAPARSTAICRAGTFPTSS